MTKDWSNFIKEKIKNYSKNQIVFTKVNLSEWLCKRNNSSIDGLKEELLIFTSLMFTERQEVEFDGKKEERFRCYFIYSKNKGRCYILGFNSQVKIITVFPLGRTTLKKYRKRFK